MSIDTDQLLALIDLVSQERIEDLCLTHNGVLIHIQLHGEATCTPMQSSDRSQRNTWPHRCRKIPCISGSVIRIGERWVNNRVLCRDSLASKTLL